MAAEIITVHRVNTTDNLYGLLNRSLAGWKYVQLRNQIMYLYNHNIY